MRGYAHSNLRIIEVHDYHESKIVLTINDNHEFKAENVLEWLKVIIPVVEAGLVIVRKLWIQDWPSLNLKLHGPAAYFWMIDVN